LPTLPLPRTPPAKPSSLPVRVLFLHNNFPGQYRRLAAALKAEPGFELACATLATNKQQLGIRRVDYTPAREPLAGLSPASLPLERAVITGEAAATAMAGLKRDGFEPDVVCAHSGWGPSLFVKDVFPKAKLLSYFEWFYRTDGADIGFLPDQPVTTADRFRTRGRNAPILMDLAAMDWGVCPTRWQVGRFPSQFRRRITVLHDGVDTDYLTPNPAATLTLPDGRVLKAGDEVVTYVARGMEPYRGFPQFMAAAAKLLADRPAAHVIVVGADRVAYGRKRTDGKTFKEAALAEHALDPDRVHFLGLVPFETLRQVFRVSAAHVYLTVPFVLSWSMLEAMACACLIVGSDTPPVREVIADGRNGLLTDFFDADRLAARLTDVLARPDAFVNLRANARATILGRYAAANLVPAQRQLLVDVATGTLPAATIG
jgi:glycosyltransferase involved in cell wall biosynthesis